MLFRQGKALLLLAGCCFFCACAGPASQTTPPAVAAKGSAASPVSGAEKEKPVVYYSKQLTPESVKQVYTRVQQDITGKVALKFHRDDQYIETLEGVSLLKALQQSIPGSTLVETTYGGGAKEAGEMRERFKSLGLDFAPIDILNEEGGTAWPVKGGRLLQEAQVAKNLANYDALVIYAPFRGQAYPGYGAALTNVGVGLQDGKGLVHGSPLNKEPAFFERMAEAGKAVTDHFGSHMAYVTVLNKVVVNCECNKQGTAPVTLGVLASKDMAAIDKAALDIIFSQKQHQGHDLTKKEGTLLGLYQLEFLTKLGVGSTSYKLVEVDAE
jgi:hypothetical protein